MTYEKHNNKWRSQTSEGQDGLAPCKAGPLNEGVLGAAARWVAGSLRARSDHTSLEVKR